MITGTLYHVETQEDYDALMVELESKGLVWNGGRECTDKTTNNWPVNGDKTYVRIIGGKEVVYGAIRDASNNDLIVKYQNIRSIKKVTVPQFVGDWIEEERKVVNDIIFSLNYQYILDGLPVDVRHWYDKNSEKFYRAILDGYEVEQEKLYYVEFPDKDGDSLNVYGLGKVYGSNIVYIRTFAKGDIGKCTSSQLTEKEIRDFDERYWAFAKGVE